MNVYLKSARPAYLNGEKAIKSKSNLILDGTQSLEVLSGIVYSKLSKKEII